MMGAPVCRRRRHLPLLSGGGGFCCGLDDDGSRAGGLVSQGEFDRASTLLGGVHFYPLVYFGTGLHCCVFTCPGNDLPGHFSA
jgi:hypothetical protein